MVYNKKGFTLIEAIMVILIIAILAVGGAYLLVYTIQNSVFLPNKLNMDMLAQDALDIMVEGDAQAKGLRFSRSVILATANLIIFRNQESQIITYVLVPGNGIFRAVGISIPRVIPYYMRPGITVTGRDGVLFTYYDAVEAPTTTAANIRRVKIELIAQTGSGSYNDWEGYAEQSSSVALKRFQ